MFVCMLIKYITAEAMSDFFLKDFAVIGISARYNHFWSQNGSIEKVLYTDSDQKFLFELEQLIVDKSILRLLDSYTIEIPLNGLSLWTSIYFLRNIPPNIIEFL